MRTAFVDTLTQMLLDHDDIVVLTADMGYSVFEKLQKQFPKRFINTGVTEQSTVGVATGLALSGYTVFFYAQAAFSTMRCFEQVRLDVGYNNVNVKIIGTAAGFSLNQLGVSHFAIEDVGLMRLIPRMTILTPGDAYEANWATKQAYATPGPVYVRLTKAGTPVVHTKQLSIKVGELIEIYKGKVITLLVSGSLLPRAVEVVNNLAKKGILVSLYSVPTIKPLRSTVVIKALHNSKIVFTLEEHSVIGGLGAVVAEIIAEEGLSIKLCRFGAQDTFTGITGSHDYLLDYNGLSVSALCDQIQKLSIYEFQKYS